MEIERLKLIKDDEEKEKIDIMLDDINKRDYILDSLEI